MKKLLTRVLCFSLLIVIFGIGMSSCERDRIPTVTLLLLGNAPTNARHAAAIERINEITRERIGAELRTRYIGWADWQTQYQLALASQDPSIDLVITSSTWLFAWEMVRRGAFYGITPQMMETYAPVTWASIPQSTWDIVTDDGFIWFIPEDQYTQFTNHGMFWRLDWARAGGLYSIDRFEDLETYWEIVRATQPQAFPWDANAGVGIFLIEAYIMGRRPVQTIVGTATGNFAIFQYYTHDPFTVVSYFMNGDELVEVAEILHRWGQRGFWREDVLNYHGDTRNMLLSGHSGSDQHHTHTFLNLREQMDREQPGSELQMFWIGKENNNVNRNLRTHGAMAINAASRNPRKALQMYDLLRNDREIYILYNFGIEGIDYIEDSPGVFSLPPGFNQFTDALDGNFWGGRRDDFEPEWTHWWNGRNDFVEHLNTFAMDYPLENFSFDGSRVAAEMAAIGDVCARFLPAIHFGKTADPVQAVADFRIALRQAGFDRVKDELQSQLNALRDR
ncbi:MAG: extracellular solute-binding protein [Treponema sp.]|nr:extracellular solute-binding protein [Treponema sp.]